MVLFINNPGSETLSLQDIRKLTSERKILVVVLEVKEAKTSEDIKRILTEKLQQHSCKKNEIYLIVFHPAIRTGSVPKKLIPLVVKSIKNWSNAFLLTISSGGEKDCLSPAKSAGSNEAIPIAQFREIWRTSLGDEKQLLAQLTKYSKREKVDNLAIEVLYLFLPLDIDIQALELLDNEKKKREKVKDPQEYLKEMYVDNINYLQKFNELQAKVKKLSEIEGIDKERLKKLAGIGNENVSRFFEKLRDKKDDTDEFLGHSWGIDGVSSFHDWYCALDLCLRV